jgi:hypothetical protein
VIAVLDYPPISSRWQTLQEKKPYNDLRKQKNNILSKDEIKIEEKEK